MKKIFLAGLCLSLSSWACAGAKESLIGKRLVMDIPEVQCAGLSFSKNGKDAAMYAELGQCEPYRVCRRLNILRDYSD
ncbi:MAG: hypothetical protein H9L35_09285, partial [Acinetobacter sp.]|nr:hypothetical protein [Acinetobacter sp.]